jgi:hypothetical protein
MQKAIQSIIIHGTPQGPSGGIIAAREQVVPLGPRGRMQIMYYEVTFDLESDGGRVERGNVTIEIPEIQGDPAHWYVKLEMEGNRIKRVGLSTEPHHSGDPVYWERE